MSQTLRRALAAALMGALGLAGCIQFEESATIFPDGSGKLTLKVAFKKSVLKMMQVMAKNSGAQELPDPIEGFTNPDKLGSNSEGIVAWSEPKRVEDGEWVRASVTGYFEDVSKVKIYFEQDTPDGRKERKLAFGAKYEETGVGHLLTLNKEPGGEPAGQNPELAKAIFEMLKPMLQGLRMSISVTVPGPIEDCSDWLEKKDRTASVAIDDKLLTALVSGDDTPEARKMKALSEAKEGRIVWKENTISDDEAKAFRKEMAEAKEKWSRILEEAKKKKADK